MRKREIRDDDLTRVDPSVPRIDRQDLPQPATRWSAWGDEIHAEAWTFPPLLALMVIAAWDAALSPWRLALLCVVIGVTYLFGYAAARLRATVSTTPEPAPAVAQSANQPGFPRRENPSSESPF